jgi:branched-chain amino acid transport system substrate-binding protein
MEGKRIVLLVVCLAVLLAHAAFGTGQAEKKEVVIGVIGPMTGSAAQSGTTMRDAVALGIEEINASGRLPNVTLKMVVVDDEGNPTKSINGNNRLVYNDRAVVVIGAVHSSCTLANMEVTQKAGVPQITPCSTSPAITAKGNKWIFRTATTDAVQAENVVNIAVKELGNKRLAVAYVSNDYGVDAYKVLLDVSNRLGVPPVAAETFNQGDKDFSAQLLKLKESSPDTLIIWSLYEEAAMIARQVARMALDVQLMGGGGLTNSKYVELGGEATNGTIMCQSYHPSSSERHIAEFTRNFQKMHGYLPEPNSAQSYDAIMIAAQALEKAGVEDKAKIRDAIAATKDFQGVTGTITFDETGDSPRQMKIIQIRNLQYELY